MDDASRSCYMHVPCSLVLNTLVSRTHQAPLTLRTIVHESLGFPLVPFERWRHESSNPLTRRRLALDWLIPPARERARLLVPRYPGVTGLEGAAISLGLNSQLAETLVTTVRQPLVISHWHFGCGSNVIASRCSDWTFHWIAGDSQVWNQANTTAEVWPVWWISALYIQ